MISLCTWSNQCFRRTYAQGWGLMCNHIHSTCWGHIHCSGLHCWRWSMCEMSGSDPFRMICRASCYSCRSRNTVGYCPQCPSFTTAKATEGVCIVYRMAANLCFSIWTFDYLLAVRHGCKGTEEWKTKTETTLGVHTCVRVTVAVTICAFKT